MTKLFSWIKQHWLVAILLLVIIYLIGHQQGPFLSSVDLPISGGGESTLSYGTKSLSAYRTPSAPSDSQNRVVIQDTSLSLTVKDVAVAIKNILTSAQSFNGFLVNSYLSQPQNAASGNITVRIPSDKLDVALTAFKQFSTKVVSESVSGTDVTDQYADLETQLSILHNTKQKFEDILNRALTVSDLMNVQQQLMNLQNQIDSIKGQQKYLEQSAKLSKITIYLSTDELSLPYAPTNVWRPVVIFKQAVRSLLGTFQSFGSLLIWIVAYLPIIIPILGIIYFVKKRRQSN